MNGPRLDHRPVTRSSVSQPGTGSIRGCYTGRIGQKTDFGYVVLYTVSNGRNLLVVAIHLDTSDGLALLGLDDPGGDLSAGAKIQLGQDMFDM